MTPCNNPTGYTFYGLMFIEIVSDKKNERKWRVFFSIVVGTIGFWPFHSCGSKPVIFNDVDT
ncbi:protein of unknown function [Candidatus Nitrosotalea okcheonensis]|uniref:Uncharacterized protein n=1 Tax=Candidatus Nitrosotalea okcheonensis TaxID=1903276 RepID=A0A2H1FCB4_9ARCH|nr:protein of unknown function [Candidatus Nitrosotalea okcheonensis]